MTAVCMWLNNPPEPSCAPVDYLRQPFSGRCGTCACVPPFWKVVGIGTTPYAQLFLPKILQRDVATFERNPLEPCHWTRFVDLASIAGHPFAGSIDLSFTSVEGSDADNPGWYLILYGLPAVGAVPADVAFYHQRVFTMPDRRPFRCLSPNTFDLDNLLGSGNFTGLPATVTVQPFWP